MKTYVGSEGIDPPFLTSALYRGMWSASRPYRFTPRETVPAICCMYISYIDFKT
jgi:hypothetical protein